MPTDHPERDRPTLLLVDDDRTMRAILRLELQSLEAEVLEASDGLEALEIVERQRPTLVLTDLEMPQMGGHELCARLASSEATIGIPVLVISSSNDEATRLRTLEQGGIDQIVKPFKPGTLLALVRGVLGRLVSNHEKVVACVEQAHRTRVDIGRLLRGQGYVTRTFSDSESFLSRMDQTLPDLVLLDLQLGDRGAYRILEQLRERGALEHLPVIASTSTGSRQELVSAFRSGARDLIRKPCFAEELLARVENQLMASSREADLRLAATRDTLTGLPNRAELMRVQDLEVSRALREKTPLGVVMVDIDHFKRLNDTHGHAFGDRVLQVVASTLAGSVRDGDCVARYGGEEFTIMCRKASGSALRFLAERIRARVAAITVEHPSGPVEVTVSLGAYSWAPSALALDMPLRELLAPADANLYEAKESGRDCWVVGKSPPSQESPQAAPATPRRAAQLA